MIEKGDTFENWGIEDGARLNVSYRNYTKLAEVAAEVAELNPPLTVEMLMENVEVHRNDPLRVIGNLDWSRKGITVLPDSIGSITVQGNLELHNNQLASLPEDFGYLRV